jgi:hypothetical protein
MTDADTWRVNPFVRPLVPLTAADGSCDYAEDVPHCHGAEIQHADGVAECWNDLGYCEAPEPGMHAFIHSCDRQTRRELHRYEHTCSRCQ